MKKLLLISAITAASSASFAATTIVEPGNDTLYNAYISAVSGDTLLLKDGNYNFTAEHRYIHLDRDIEIKGINSDTNAILNGYHYNFLECFYDKNGYSVNLIIENATLKCSISIDDAENITLLNVDIRNNQKFGGEVKNLKLIGNEINSHLDIYADDSIISGNEIYSSIDIEYSAGITRFIGNNFQYVGNSYSGNSITSTGESSFLNLRGSLLNFWGNRVNHWLPDSNISDSTVVHIDADIVDMRNNIFINAKENSDYGNLIDENKYHQIVFREGTLKATLENNVFETASKVAASANDHSAIYSEAPLTFRSNVLTGSPHVPLEFNSTVIAEQSNIENNIFFNNRENPTDNNNLAVDPSLDDNYKPLAQSPAIDAGFDSDKLKDIDGTRNDIGAYGGLFPIDQFDVQREEGRTAPYLYPLMKAQSGYSPTQGLLIEYVGYARQ